jgi:uncharacterized repeat protein (TIGR01451 family)
MNVRRMLALLGAVAAPAVLAALLLGVAETPEAYGALDPYWKESWDDYTPSGLPDFDQKQDAWGNGLQWTYCGPVAAANSLWWYDSKFEAEPREPLPEPGKDGYPLVQAYGLWDDHWIENVIPLVDDLATNYFGTDPDTGTNVYDMYYGMQQYLYDQGLYDDYLVTLAISPTMEWVVEEVLRSEDVILLLGMWEWVDPDGTAGSGDEFVQRIGGHYVTVAGLDLTDPQMPLIALSDPFMDMAEQGWPGRVGNGVLLLPHTPGHGPVEHNDAGNVSHDYYIMAPSPTPGGVWGLADYPPPPDAFLWADDFAGVNAHPNYLDGAYLGGPIFSEVEFAIAMSPFVWKRGEWIDYAPSGMPDFSQIQDAWGPNPFAPPWTYCGPVAVANSLWWFDSKFEPNPVPGWVPNDNYPLVISYGPWDDHDPLNVETQTPTFELVDELASLMGPLPLASGTIITDMVNGTRDYLALHGLTEDYTVTQVHEPEWEWVVEEVMRSEDVVLLLGFWYWDPSSGYWFRMGGHYVTVAGVDPVSGLVGFADPYFDQAELGWPWLGRFFPPGHPPHAGLIPDMVHNDARFLSHDVYHAVPSPSPGGLWGPDEYPAQAGMINFEGQNGPSFVPVPGPPPPDPSKLYTEVEWAMAVSPKPPDLVITKTVTPTRPLLPGDWLTYTVVYTNIATPWTYNVVITDLVPAELIDANVTCLTSFGTPIAVSDRYVLEVGRLGYMAGGACTITARIDPGITDTTRSIVNEVKIHTVTAERNNTNNGAAVKTAVQTADVWAGKERPAKIVAGDPLTYTLSYGNDGPADAENVALVDVFPDGASYVGDSSGLAGAPVTGGRGWVMGPLTSSGSATFVLTLSLPADTPAGIVVTNTLSISTTTPESRSDNNEVEVDTDVFGRIYLPLVLRAYKP